MHHKTSIEEVQRQPGEPRAGRHQAQAGRPSAQHRGDSLTGLPEQPVEEAVEGRRPAAGRYRDRRGVDRGPVVDPWPGGEVARAGISV